MELSKDLRPPQIASGVRVGSGAYLDRSPGMVEVLVDRAVDLDGALNQAIGVVRAAAEEHETGIMVTRIGPGSYIVRADPVVPFGLVRQRHG
ncbi:hypothetical protein [Paenarthrobacter nicotinovorans]|uniref:hypothetical protein n=1 Tax=Paenarthrobacter nicotinovorans TaxID=29320 RepID=UPI00374987A7